MGGTERFCQKRIKRLSLMPSSELFIVCEKTLENFKDEIKNCNVKILEIGLSGVNSEKLTATIGWMLLPQIFKTERALPPYLGGVKQR